MLSIAGRAGHAFIAPAMMEGFVCHARGVELVSCGATRVHARVRSKRTHDVLLKAEQGRLSIACTCPARTYGLDFCKHAWAALLEVDRQEGLSDLRRTRGPLAVDAAPPAPSGVGAPPASSGADEAIETKPPTRRRNTGAPRKSEPDSPPKTARVKEAKARPAVPAVETSATTRRKSPASKTPRASNRDTAPTEASSKKSVRKAKRR
jgi:hypothetical protein